jgi:pyruvate/2-oxoglutarate dehydrogenase complex dihydrolipoamide dehydrogenase (E3) component
MGCAVTLIQRNSQLLTGLDRECSDVVAKAYTERGITVHLGAHLTGIVAIKSKKLIEFTLEGQTHAALVDQILLAMGRKPATGGLNLAAAAIAAHKGKVVINDRMQTSQPHIFAAGDVCSPLDVVHLAIQQGEIAARNAHSLLNNKAADETIDYRLQLFGVFSHPQVACVGATTEKLKKDGIPYLSASYPFNDHGKSMVMGETAGFVQMHAHAETGEILGACVVGPEATELIHEVVIAMNFRATVKQFMAIPHYHPTLSEIWTYPAEEIADQLVA